MSFGTLGFLQEHTATETPAQALARQAYQAAERADRQAERDEADQAAALEEAAEARAFRFRALNVQPGAVLARAQQEQEEDFEYDACRAQMERIERRRESRRRAAEAQAAQFEAASRASREPEGIEAANRLAARLATPAARGRRPFAVRGQADHQCVYCDRENLDPDTSFLLHNDPQFNVPITTAEQATQEDLDYLSQDTGQRSVAAYNRHPAVAAEAAAYEAEDRARVISR